MGESRGERPVSRRQALGALGALALPLGWPELAGAAPLNLPDEDAQGGPDLGNLFGTVEWVARQNAPSLSFLDPRWRSLEAWKRAARAELRRALAFDPNPLPVRGERVGMDQRDGFTVETLRIHASPAYAIPARLLVPSRRSGRLPAVVALHSHGGEYQWGSRKLVSAPDDPPALVQYRERLYGRPYAEELARRGFVVIAVDAFYFGERRLHPESLDRAAVPADGRDAFQALAALEPGSREHHAALNRVAGSMEAVVAKTLLATGASWPGLLTWDDRRTVDYLARRPEVDPARIGCIGFSGGGLRSAFLAAADPRIRAACVAGWMTRLGPMLPLHARRHTWMAYTPGLQRRLDLPDVAALAAPAALLVQQCARDSLFPLQGMRGAVQDLARAFAKAGIPERFQGSFADVPHSYFPGMQDEAFAWLDRWL